MKNLIVKYDDENGWMVLELKRQHILSDNDYEVLEYCENEQQAYLFVEMMQAAYFNPEAI